MACAPLGSLDNVGAATLREEQPIRSLIPAIILLVVLAIVLAFWYQLSSTARIDRAIESIESTLVRHETAIGENRKAIEVEQSVNREQSERLDSQQVAIDAGGKAIAEAEESNRKQAEEITALRVRLDANDVQQQQDQAAIAETADRCSSLEKREQRTQERLDEIERLLREMPRP